MSDDESISTIKIESISAMKLSRGERKARKLLLKNNEKRIENVSRVVFRQNDGTLYVIDNPEVYKYSKAGTFIVFGEVVNTTLNLNQMEVAKAAIDINASIAVQEKMEPSETSEEDDDCTVIDETGLNALDVELVMSQASVSRHKAIFALRNNDNDLVNTIMDLTQ